jgi:hypothetical protein
MIGERFGGRGRKEETKNKCYNFTPLLDVLLAFISLSFFDVPLYDTSFPDTFLFRVMSLDRLEHV